MRPNGQAIRAIREARRLSLRVMQQRTGLDRGYLSRMERNLIRNPADAPVLTIATALDVTPDAITHEELP
ncbi:helix-turn-helix domain-containing protein [Streptomyces sp. NPDC001493]